MSFGLSLLTARLGGIMVQVCYGICRLASEDWYPLFMIIFPDYYHTQSLLPNFSRDWFLNLFEL